MGHKQTMQELLDICQRRGDRLDELEKENIAMREALKAYQKYYCLTNAGKPVENWDNEMNGERKVRLEIETILKNLSI